MKEFIPLGVVVLTICTACQLYGEAAVNLNNFDSDAVIYDWDRKLAVGSNDKGTLWVQVLGGRVGFPLAPLRNTRGEDKFSLTLPGYFDEWMGMVPGVADYEQAQFQVRVWRGGDSFDTAAMTGQSPIFVQKTGAVTETPPFSDPAPLLIPQPIRINPICYVGFPFMLWIGNPRSQEVKEGDNVTMEVYFHNRMSVFDLQWFFNGTKLVGATNATLLLTNVSVANAGAYSVSLSDPCGSITSQAAILTVLTPACILPDSLSRANGQFSFTLQSEPGSRVDIQVSTNLLEWSRLATLTNASGTLPFTDTDTSLQQRFYRAR